MYKVLQENLKKYVMNLSWNKDKEISFKKFIVALAVEQARDY